MARRSAEQTAIVRVDEVGNATMNDHAVALLFGCSAGQIAARRRYGQGTPFESAPRAMRKRAAQRRKTFTKATGRAPELIDVICWYARREGVGVLYRRAGEDAVMIAPDGTDIPYPSKESANV